MRTVRNRIAPLLLALILCFPMMSIRADAINMTNAMVDGGFSHSIALSSSGIVYTWGSNQQMQLGYADVAERRTPRQIIGLRNTVAVAAGYDFSVALHKDGTVYTWGGSIQSSPTVVSGLSNIIAIDAGQNGILALDQSGNVWQWSLRDSAPPVQVQGLSNIAAISAGGGHYLALTFYGDVYAWGDNLNGQLGIGNTTNSATPQKVDIHNIIDISAGQAHSLAVDFDGTVYAWGLNFYGQLGNGRTINSNVPVQTKVIQNAVQVSAGNDMSMARTKDGELYTWGYGEYGQLGYSNAPLSQSTPQVISDLPNKPAYIACGVYHNLYVSPNGNLYTWGRNRNYQLGIEQNSNIDIPMMVDKLTTTTAKSYKTNALASASSWALPELEALYKKDIISPIIWWNFQERITRAEFIHMLVTVYEQVKDEPIPKKSTRFEDTEGSLFEEDITKAYNLGLVSGTSATTFSPDNPLTRQETATMLCNFLTQMLNITIPQKVTSMVYYKDASSIADWAAPSVAYAYRENIMQGSEKYFNPKSYLSREQGLLLLGRVIEKYQWG